MEECCAASPLTSHQHGLSIAAGGETIPHFCSTSQVLSSKWLYCKTELNCSLGQRSRNCSIYRWRRQLADVLYIDLLHIWYSYIDIWGGCINGGVFLKIICRVVSCLWQQFSRYTTLAICRAQWNDRYNLWCPWSLNIRNIDIVVLSKMLLV